MTLAALIRGARAANSDKSATATLATPATLEGAVGRTVATVATVTVANSQKSESDTLPDRAADPECVEQIAELRRLVEAIARMAPSYWTLVDIEEAVAIGMTDYDNALMTFRALAEEYGVLPSGSESSAHGVRHVT